MMFGAVVDGRRPRTEPRLPRRARVAVDVGLVPRVTLVRLSRSGRCLHPFSFSLAYPRHNCEL